MCEKKIRDISVIEIGQSQNYKEGEKADPIQFEEALKRTGFGKFNYILIFLCGIILSTVLLETLGISFVLPVAQCELQLTTQQKGLLSAIAFAGIISSSHLWGFLADTIGRRKIILPTLLISFACSFLSSFTTSFVVLVVLRYFCGFFISGSSATVYAYLSEFHSVKNRSRAIMGASVIFACSSLLLPGIAWLIINQEWSIYVPMMDTPYRPWRLFMIVCGLPSLLSAIALIKLPESPKFVLQFSQEKSINIIRRIYVFNGQGSESDFQITSIYDESILIAKMKSKGAELKSVSKILKAMWHQTAPLFMSAHLKTTVIACTIQFSIFFSSNGLYMWFPDILNRISEFVEHNPNNTATICEIMSRTSVDTVAHLNLTTLEMATECITKLEIETYTHTLMLEFIYVVGFAIIGLVINATGKLPILLFVLIGCGVAGIATAFVTNSVLAVYLYIILLSVGLVISVVNAATVDLYPTNLRAMAVCISLMMGRLGSVVGSNVAAFLFEYHCPSAFVFSGSLLIASGLLCFFIPNICRLKCMQSTKTIHDTVG